MQTKPEELYLDLLKKTLSFTLWPEPPIPVETFNSVRRKRNRFLVSFVSRTLKKVNLQLGQIRNFTEEERIEGAIWPGYADTMIGLKRLDNIQYCIETVIKDGVEGDFIETGVWRGGASIFMRGVLAAHGIEDRKIFVADSFEGLPKPDAEKYPADKDDFYYLYSYLAVSQEEVENNFKKYNLLDDKIVFLKGWFKDTLPVAPIEKLAVVRLDGDMYGSTMDALSNLYHKLSKGGFCIIDDYTIPGCKKAVHDYREQFNIKSEIMPIDKDAVFWRKTD